MHAYLFTYLRNRKQQLKREDQNYMPTVNPDNNKKQQLNREDQNVVPALHPLIIV